MKSLEELRAAIREAANLIEPDPAIDKLIALFLETIKKPSNFMGLKQVADELGVELSTASMRVHRGIVPPPSMLIANRRIWTRYDFEAFLERNPRVIRHNVHQEAS